MLLYPPKGVIYNCKQEVQKDWDEYKVFYHMGKGFVSKSDVDTMRITHPHIKGQEVFIKYRKGESCVVDVI